MGNPPFQEPFILFSLAKFVSLSIEQFSSLKTYTNVPLLKEPTNQEYYKKYFVRSIH